MMQRGVYAAEREHHREAQHREVDRRHQHVPAGLLEQQLQRPVEDPAVGGARSRSRPRGRVPGQRQAGCGRLLGEARSVHARKDILVRRDLRSSPCRLFMMSTHTRQTHGGNRNERQHPGGQHQRQQIAAGEPRRLPLHSPRRPRRLPGATDSSTRQRSRRMPRGLPRLASPPCRRAGLEPRPPEPPRAAGSPPLATRLAFVADEEEEGEEEDETEELDEEEPPALPPAPPPEPPLGPLSSVPPMIAWAPAPGPP